MEHSLVGARNDLQREGRGRFLLGGGFGRFGLFLEGLGFLGGFLSLSFGHFEQFSNNKFVCLNLFLSQLQQINFFCHHIQAVNIYACMPGTT